MRRERSRSDIITAGRLPPACLNIGDLDPQNREEARRQAGEGLAAWLAKAEPVISRADVRHIAALASHLRGYCRAP